MLVDTGYFEFLNIFYNAFLKNEADIEKLLFQRRNILKDIVPKSILPKNHQSKNLSYRIF